MTPTLIISLITGYFSILMLISYFTSREKVNSEAFFLANRKSPWYIVAFGMIGTSLSGVTFISVPGLVRETSFSYLQLVLGYLLGYLVIGTVLMPLYYKLNLVSIYTYLEQRFGYWSYKTGAFFFLLSRTIGAAFRMYLVAGVLHLAVFKEFGMPFWLTVVVSIVLIWIYTFRGGMKTIIWTDTFQTLAMLVCVGVSIWLISSSLNLGPSELVSTVVNNSYSETFFWDYKDDKYFFKQFFSGAFIAIVMTGLDQDMMQKNLSCKNIKEAQKNMFCFSIILVGVNLLFLTLGVLLYHYAETMGIALPNKSDDVFPFLALNHFSLFAGIVFILGVIAITYASADSALTALTTSFCVDFMAISKYAEKQQDKIRTVVHISFSLLLAVVILLFSIINDQSVITAVFKVAGYTYGPLLGLYAFGLFTKMNLRDKLVPVVCVISPVLTYLINLSSDKYLYGYKFGFELLMVNGLLTFIGLLLISTKKQYYLETIP